MFVRVKQIGGILAFPYVARDGGTNWDKITLSDDGDYENGKRILSGEVRRLSVSGCPTSMQYKITTNGVDLSKNTRGSIILRIRKKKYCHFPNYRITCNYR